MSYITVGHHTLKVEDPLEVRIQFKVEILLLPYQNRL